MERKQIKNFFILKHYSFFKWEQCVCCKKDFRREPGWVLKHKGAFSIFYVCKKCKPTYNEAYNYFMNMPHHIRHEEVIEQMLEKKRRN